MEHSRRRQPSTLELLLGNKSGDSGVTELAGLAVLWLGGSVVLLSKSRLFARLGRPMALRYPLLVLLHCLCITITGCLQRRVASKWRQNITRKLHRFYFEKQNFYRLQSETKEHVIADADLRICRDVLEMSHATSEVAVAFIEAFMKTLVICGSALIRRRWIEGFLPPAAFLLAVKLVLGTHPADGKSMPSSLQHFEGRLKQHFLRLQSRAHEILMMQGEAFELDLLQKALRDTSSIARRLYDVMFPMEMSEWILLHSSQAASLLELVAFVSAAMGAKSRKSFRIENFLYIFQNFFSVCSSWNAFLSARTLLMGTSAATNRVKQLYVRLEALEAPAKARPKRRAKEAKEPPEEIVDKGDVLSFRSVTIHSPGKQALLRDLTLCISLSGPLLICGQASGGKTALARCLFGLWPISCGQLSRPGGAARHVDGIPLPEDIIYVPEKPQLGWSSSLSDEVTFPRPMPAGLPQEELYRWLAYVGLAHVREDTPLPQLSLREQQALGFARLLFHRPRFAILDECTSALGPDLERHFLRLLRELGICYITVSRRASQSLKDEHSRMLVVQGARGEDTRGWKLFELPELEAKPRCRCSAEVFQRLDSYLKTEPYDTWEAERVPASSSSAGPVKELRWRSPAARLWATLRLGLLSSGRRRTILQKLGLILLLLHARTKLYWRFYRGLSGSLQALQAGAWGVKELVLCGLVAVACGFADELLRYQSKLSTLELWSGAVGQLQRKLLRELTLLRVEVTEPMHRLSEVRSLFEALGCCISEALLPLAQLIFLAPFLVRHLKVSSLLFLGHFLLLRLLRWQPRETEDPFQARHKRLRSCAEALALSCRGITERQSIEEDFEVLASTELRKHSSASKLLHHFVVTALGDFRQLPSCALRLLSLKFFASCASCQVHALSETFLFDRMLQSAFIAVQQLSKCAEKVGRLDGQCLRCLELVVEVEAASRKPPLASEADPFHVEMEELVTEDGIQLARRLHFDLAVNQALLICGPKGFELPLLQQLLGFGRRLPRQTMMLATHEPYVPPYCRLLAQLAYPLLLRLPSHAPFTVQVLLPEDVEEAQLRRHFGQLGASNCQVVVERGSRKGLIHFSTFEETIKAVARPQDRVIGDTELQCEIAAEKTVTPGEAVPQLGRMRQCLQEVGLDHILTREPDGWFARRAWTEILTREEQQRLSLARVLYHQPSFCILEEATCSLPFAQEAELHAVLLRYGVTPVALASQPFLENIYRQQLHVGLAQGDGWKLVES